MYDRGFDSLTVSDQAVGANTINWPHWNLPYAADSPFREPLMMARLDAPKDATTNEPAPAAANLLRATIELMRW